MRRPSALLIAALTAAAVLASAVPASAESRSLADPSGDAPAFLDITDVLVHNARHTLVVKTLVPGFDPSNLAPVGSTTSDGDDWGTLFLYLTVKGADGSAWTPKWGEQAGRFAVEIGPSGVTQPLDTILLGRARGGSYYDGDTGCTGLDADVRAGIITATIPQTCFRRVKGAGAGAVKVKAVMRGNVGPRSTEDRTYTTAWVHRAPK